MLNIFKKNLTLEELLNKAIENDDVKLFRELNSEDKFSNKVLAALYKNHSVNILKEFSFYFNLTALGDYNLPLWWKAFSHSSKDYQSYELMIEFLSSHVDFNECFGNFGKYSLFYDLIQSYKYKMVYYFINLNKIDFNRIHHEERQENLSHCISRLEHGRFYAFVQSENKTKSSERGTYVYQVLKEVINNSDLKLKNKQNKSSLDFLTTFYQSYWMIEKFKLENMLSEEQFFNYKYISCYHSKKSEDFNQNELKLSTPEKHLENLYREVIFKENGIYILNKQLLRTKEENKHYLNIKELSNLERVVLPNGTELYKEK